MQSEFNLNLKFVFSCFCRKNKLNQGLTLTKIDDDAGLTLKMEISESSKSF